MENIIRYVRVTGEAQEDPNTGRISSIQIRDLYPLEAEEFQSYNFWKAWSFEELAEQQKVRPLEDIFIFFGAWSGDIDDDFEETIRRLRHQESSGAAGAYVSAPAAT